MKSQHFVRGRVTKTLRPVRGRVMKSTVIWNHFLSFYYIFSKNVQGSMAWSATILAIKYCNAFLASHFVTRSSDSLKQYDNSCVDLNEGSGRMRKSCIVVIGRITKSCAILMERVAKS